MRGTILVFLSLLAAFAAPALAQEWVEFVGRDDGFRVNFPGTPAVRTTTFTSEYGAALPAHPLRDGSRGCLLGFLIPDPWTSP